MRLIPKILLFTLLFSSCSENNKPVKTAVIVDKPRITYCLIVLDIRFPKLIQEEIRTDLPPSPYYSQVSYKHTVKWESLTYVSDVLELSNLTEDDKYKLIDKFEKSIYYNLETIERDYAFKVNTAFGLTDQSRQDLLRNEVLIVNRRMKQFETYKKASKNRQIYL